MLLEERREQMDGAPIVLPGSFEGFAVYANWGIGSAYGWEPSAQGSVDGFSIDRLQKSADRRFTGWQILLGFFVVAAAQALEHVLRAALGPFGHGGKAASLAQQGTDGDGQDGEFAVTDAPGQTGVGDLPQSLEQIGRLFLGELLRRGYLGQFPHERRVGEFFFRLRLQGANEDHLGLLMRPVALAVFAKSLSETEKGPAGRPVAGPLEVTGIDEGFG